LWIYKGEEFLDPTDYYGFVYCITNLTNNRKYIGRKYFWRNKTYQLKGKKKKKLVQSDWQKYWGSNKELLKDIKELGKDNFRREILFLCRTRGMVNYMEAKEQFNRGVLEDIVYYNDWIMIKLHRSSVKKEAILC
jgi:hypothetical protein